MIRFAFNEFNPEAANIVKVTDKRNMTENVDKLKKRLTHKFGFMMDIEANNEYLMVFSSAERVSNMSYESAFYGLAPGDWLVIKHNLLKKPDQLRIGGKLLKESETSLDAAVNANGDWYWDNSTWTASYLIKVCFFLVNKLCYLLLFILQIWENILLNKSTWADRKT